MRISFLLFALFFCLKFTSGQQFKSFSVEAEYIPELTQFLGKNPPKELKLLLEAFSLQWGSGGFDDPQKQQVLATSNLLLKRKALPTPDFHNYIKALLAFSKTAHDKNSYFEWEKGVADLIETHKNTLTKLNELFISTQNLLSDSIIFKSPSGLWKSDNNNYRFYFEIDNKQLRATFDKLNLFCISKKDTSIIKETQGVLLPDKYLWYGNNGTITWKRANLPENEVYAQLKYYTIELNRFDYKADSVSFNNSIYFKEPLLGKLQEKMQAGLTGEKANYPRFDSYDKYIPLRQVTENIDYLGGFSQQGPRFVGAGDEQNDASITVSRNGKLFISASSKQFVFEKKQIYSENTAISLRFEKDSISHPGANLRIILRENNKEIIISKGNQGLSKSPFFNNYHKIDMDVQELTWLMNDTTVYLDMAKGSANPTAIFESVEFFSDSKFQQIQLMDKTHPLIVVRNFSYKKTSLTFTGNELAVDMKMPGHLVRQMLMKLSYQGFVSYNIKTDEVKVLQRIYDYLGASKGKKDYDALSIVSSTRSESGFGRSFPHNAILNLNNSNLDIYGVKEVVFSNPRKVSCRPQNGQITVKQNRNITFNGRLIAGLFDFYGKKFSFDYDSFDIKMPFVDSLKLLVRTDTVNKKGFYEPIPVASPIEKFSGLLKVDLFNNKSGVQNYFEYPIFTCFDSSKVFYNKGNEGNEAYNPEKFYFAITPFTIDSLNSLSRKGIQIPGTFVSGGIFPPFVDTLSVQRDSSLGFIRPAPETGIKLFGGSGLFHYNIVLNKQGLSGDGEIRYLTSTIRSRNFAFYPDSINCHATEFSIAPVKADSSHIGDSTFVEIPQASADSVYVHWAPGQGTLNAKNEFKPFSMFDGMGNFKGTLSLQPKGLKGDGELNLKDAILEAKELSFREHQVKSDTTKFSIKPTGKDVPPLLIDNVNAYIDLHENYGLFKSNGDMSVLKLPLTQYECYIDQFVWEIQKRKIDIGLDAIDYLVNKQKAKRPQLLPDPKTEEYLKALNLLTAKSKITKTDSIKIIVYKAILDSMENIVIKQFAAIDSSIREDVVKGLQIKKTKFVSVRPDQDSLYFYSGASNYNLSENQIKARDIKQIRVADATIYPSGNITIEKNAKILAFSNAGITADTINLYHFFKNATVNIINRKSYTARGDYSYIDENRNVQILHFDKISVDSNIHTVATGRIAEKDSFKLSPNFLFYGIYKLTAKEQYMTFTGNAKLIHSCKNIGRSPIFFSSKIKPDSILIPIPEKFEVGTQKLVSGNLITIDSSHVYSAFLSPKKSYSDSLIISSSGYLFFDKMSDYYIISSRQKIDSFDIPGNYLKMNKKFCYTYGEGNMDYYVDLGAVTISSAGNITNNPSTNTITFNTILSVDFFISPQIIKLLADKINSNIMLDPVDQTAVQYKKKLSDMIGTKRAESVLTELSIRGQMAVMPQELNRTIVFSDLKFKWDSRIHAYISYGKIGIGNIYGTQVNKYVPGYVQIIKRRSGDVLNVYLETNENEWFYFTYSLETMKCISSVTDFNDMISKLKDKERTLKPQKGKPTAPYAYYLGDDRLKSKFLSQFDEKIPEEEQYLKDNEKIYNGIINWVTPKKQEVKNKTDQ